MAKKNAAADLKAAKEKRQKKIAIIGGVLLLAIMGIQVPRTMKMLNPPAPATAAPVTTAATPAPATPAPAGGDVPLAPPTLSGGGGTTAAPAAPGAIADSDPLPIVENGQLVSFGRFESKDPFQQQIDDSPAPSESAPVEQDEEPAASEGEDGVLLPGADPATPSSSSGGSEPTPAAKPTSAVITLNGDEHTVPVTTDFPKDDPLFTLVSLRPRSAQIAIAGGSYTNGRRTVTLEQGKTLTLMNTADGTRYELRLVSAS